MCLAFSAPLAYGCISARHPAHSFPPINRITLWQRVSGQPRLRKGLRLPAPQIRAKAADGKPRFEFYNILPNTEEPVTDQQLKQTTQQPASKDKYFLQAGSFQNAGDADNLKAKLAMLGVEATVQDVNLPEKGVMHRVRVGPFANVDEMKQVRASLQQNGVQSSLIKIHEGVQ